MCDLRPIRFLKQFLEGGDRANGHVVLAGGAAAAAPDEAPKGKGKKRKLDPEEAAAEAAAAEAEVEAKRKRTEAAVARRRPIPTESDLLKVDQVALDKVPFDTSVHVTHKGTLAWNAQLSLVDLSRNVNKFYSLQGLKVCKSWHMHQP